MATYVLIPGAGGRAWYWHRLVPELRARGHDVVAVQLPADDDTAGLAEYADTVCDVIGDRISHSGVKDRGFMDSIYFEDPLGLLIELASYRFEPPAGHTHADVLLEAHRIRVGREDYNIDREHVADAIEALTARSRDSLSDDRSPKAAYR